MYKNLSLLLLLILTFMLISCSEEEIEESSTSSDKGDNVKESDDHLIINGEAQPTKTHQLTDEFSIKILESEMITVEDVGDPYITETEVFRIVSKNAFESCPSGQENYLDLPNKNDGRDEALTSDLSDNCYQKIVQHPFGEVQYDITKVVTSYEPPLEPDELKENNYAVMESSPNDTSKPHEVTDIDLANYPSLKESFNYYLKVEGTYGEDDRHNERLDGREYVIHRLVKVEPNIRYAVNFTYPKDIETEELIEKSLAMASTLSIEEN
ncbi:hypothetical protein ACM26V_17030 [Salipaludibacillus sp. HK11]|uniref:hypothetical protein n=1 Tax=Salipaludibacillus sp. HK11 TaxID=3394320 RepID=UPI0039FD16C2